MRRSLRSTNEQGSIAITVMVSVIATAVTAAMLTTVYRDIRVSRRSGDAANALQVADAGMNDAVRTLRNAVAVVGGCPTTPDVPAFSRTSSLAGGTYTYCAFPDTDADGRSIWHIDAVATDATGVKRRVRAEAVSSPLFPNAINVIATGSFSSGFSVDSFKDEVNRCTKKGIVGTNSPSTFSWGNNGNSSENCQNVPNTTYPYPPDGCVAFSDKGDQAIPSGSIGTGRCPPGKTTTASPKFTPESFKSPDTFDVPTNPAHATNDFTCTTPTLQAGKTYVFAAVTIGVGCGFAAAGPFPTMATPTKIFATSLTIAGGAGAGAADNRINPPPNSAAVCGSTHTQAGANPWYCPGWSGGLQLYVTGSTVKFTGNHSTFWGVIKAPNAAVTWSAGGGSQWEIFGSMVANSVGASSTSGAGGGGGGGVQAKWHYDENLGKLTSGRFFAQNWREEPLE